MRPIDGRSDSRRRAGRMLICSLLMSTTAVARGGEDWSTAEFAKYVEVAIPAPRAPGAWLGLFVPAAVFDDAQPSLADLRLVNAAGAVVPYALRVLAPRVEDRVIAGRAFDVVRDDDGAVETSLDLGESTPEHTALEVDLPGVNYRRHARLEAADQPGQWKLLAEADLIDFKTTSHEALVNRLTYPPSRARYLRVRVFPDPVVDKQPLELLQTARAHYAVNEPGEWLESPAVVEPRDAAPVAGSPGSRWIIRLAAKNLPVSALVLDVADLEFARNYSVRFGYEVDGQAAFGYAGSGMWTRPPGKPPEPITLLSEQQSAVGTLRLDVTDYANRPLDITAARTRGAQRELIFADTAELRGPLRLYWANPSAVEPHYDLEKRLPSVFTPPPRRIELGEPRANPDYVPPPLPLTERWPWAIYLVLSVATITLAAVYVALGRRILAAA